MLSIERAACSGVVGSGEEGASAPGHLCLAVGATLPSEDALLRSCDRWYAMRCRSEDRRWTVWCCGCLLKTVLSAEGMREESLKRGGGGQGGKRSPGRGLCLMQVAGWVHAGRTVARDAAAAVQCRVTGAAVIGRHPEGGKLRAGKLARWGPCMGEVRGGCNHLRCMVCG